MRILYALSICILAIFVFVIMYSIYNRPRPEICICDTLSILPATYDLPSALNDYMLRYHNPKLADVYMELIDIDCINVRGRITNNSAYTVLLRAGYHIEHYCELERQWRIIPIEMDFAIPLILIHPGEYFPFFTRIREVNNMQYSGLFRIVKTVNRDVNPYDYYSPRFIDSERHSIAAMFSW